MVMSGMYTHVSFYHHPIEENGRATRLHVSETVSRATEQMNTASSSACSLFYKQARISISIVFRYLPVNGHAVCDRTLSKVFDPIMSGLAAMKGRSVRSDSSKTKIVIFFCVEGPFFSLRSFHELK